jgi:hypothetical protein
LYFASTWPDWWSACRFRASADMLTVNPPSDMPTAISVLTVTDLRPPHLVVLSGHARGALIPLHWFKKILSSAVAPRRHTTGAFGGLLFLHPRFSTQGV